MTWVVTDEREEERKAETAAQLAAVAAGVDEWPTANQEGAISLLWTAALEDCRDWESFVTALSTGRFYRYAQDSRSVDCITDTFCYFALISTRGLPSLLRHCQDRLFLQADEMSALRAELSDLANTVDRTLSDFARILGGDGAYSRGDVISQLLSSRKRSRRLRRHLTRAWRRLPAAQLSSMLPTEDVLRGLARAMTPSTQEAVRQILPTCTNMSLRRINRKGQGAKPGALNAAYRQMRSEGLLSDDQNIHFLVIDSDSLLPSHALTTIADVVMCDQGDPCVVQLASLPTANFFCGNWFSHFVAVSDAIGALGKWSRSTRRRLRPDLNAGSGVVVPAVLAEHLREVCGNPWDETTLTEDARLIIGQFGSTNGAQSRTVMAPVYLLEAVPFATTLRSTFVAFWNQRRRWTTGGLGEIPYLLRTPEEILFSRFRRPDQRWTRYVPTRLEKLAARARQFSRLASWVWDHFLWGLGGFLILTHWWLFALFLGSPGFHVRELATLTLVLTPLAFLIGPGRQIGYFVPGGFSPRHAARLYLASFVAIWLYCLPMAFYQLLSLLGLRSRITGWKPTPKPSMRTLGAVVGKSL